ncbi:hypothetical protein SAICODRAFT_17718 [Saitoella complicata NRRL Y-17804]|uniref:uncharacterized protein n=1 Tax=Saitoella complicata (strain BCRC 22490 / CBS 7301 / JCM 7358 / NBRC 10748 / NRRL Y-17804) TaxID=698492 RepID=UPI000867A673|nr:uncharacterized protein SAICODRAFT_17718 [Saitoella complicata NRRL Y-17804]ODQ54723.1 hypothetical protein SAICODRAFT_17718 [Saitoella complicata NRRL Y-17804]
MDRGRRQSGATVPTRDRDDEDLSDASPRQSHTPPAESKKDKKRRDLGDRLSTLTASFYNSREAQFRQTLSNLQAELESLHDGTHPLFVDGVADLGVARDEELVRLHCMRDYALERADAEYEREVEAAEQEYIEKKRSIREKVLAGLISRRQRIREDKELVDISTDSNLLLSITSMSDAIGATDMLPAESARKSRRNMPGRALEELLGSSSNGKKRKGTPLVDEWGMEKEKQRTGRPEREKAFSFQGQAKEIDINEDLMYIRKITGKKPVRAAAEANGNGHKGLKK